MRSTYDHVTATLSRFSAIARANAEAPTANSAAALLTEGNILKDNGKPFTGHDIRQWRSTNRSLTPTERDALLRANDLLAGES